MGNFFIGFAKCFQSIPGAVFAIATMAVDVYLVNVAVDVANLESVVTAIVAVLATITIMSIIRYVGIIGMLIIVFVAAIAVARYYDKIENIVKL